MRKIAVFACVLASVSFIIACGKTELNVTNGPNSSGKINDVVWADGDATWNSGDGYALNTATGAKEVSKTSGSITCSVFTGANYVAATVTEEGSANQSFSLSDGSSNTITIRATQ